ncbi:MAG: YggS family pyridoxal phosphate enzyme [Bacteroidota bacterium]|nr:MAG: YggS family pyridoxal phosphate enzyme [Bacteroidota bacterium]
MRMISDNLKSILSKLPKSVTLVAVSKTKPNAAIMEAYDAGHRVFGENKVQDMVAKFEQLPSDIQWHMIGHLQTNKVKNIAPFVSLIHGVDSLKLIKEIDKRAAQNNRIIDCLLQIHIAEEETKFGLSDIEAAQVLASAKHLKNVRVRGLMGMATNTRDESIVRNEFAGLKELFLKFQSVSEHLQIISMGMSTDYEIAIEQGSTMVRVGTAIFGRRN